MILNKLEINNYGVYQGKQEFDLAPRRKYRSVNPIILFGGKNGTGKTTILESINLCLYGQSAMGTRVTKKEYEQYIFDKIYKNGARIDSQLNAAISLEFQHSINGQQDEYRIQRSWVKNQNKINEYLNVKRNGAILTDLDPDQWNTFLKELIPPGVAQLFFFDGEKIRKLSGEEQLSQPYFTESVKSLLGVDLIDRLKRDLTIYSKRLAVSDQNNSIFQQKFALENERDTLKQQLEEIRQDRSQIETKIQRIKNEIDKVEANIAALGGEFFAKYNDLKIRRTKLQFTKDNTKDLIREECHGLFPFSICQNLCTNLIKRIDREVNSFNSRKLKMSIEEHIKSINEEIENFLTNKIKLKIDKNQTKMIINKLASISNNKLDELGTDTESLIIQDLSHNDIEEIRIWIERATNEIPHKMKSYCELLANVEDDISKVESNLSRVPSEDLLKPILKELNHLNQEIGSLELNARQLDEKISISQTKIAKLDSQVEKINEKISDNEDIEKRLQTIVRIQNVLNSFNKELKNTKITELEDTIELLFSKLSRKDDLIHNVKINPSDLAISLLDNHGDIIPKHRLSSGEKQIFAIALLWALRRISGRPIPVIIDTPLSRLDKDHRDNLVNHYFPSVSHQTLILSTDTEIDKGYFDSLSKFISHTYHLNFIDKEKRTIPELGYFFKKN